MIPPAETGVPPPAEPGALPPGPVAGVPLLVPEIAPPPKLRDAALVLPLMGAFLLLPPLTDLFMAPVRIAGIPLIVLYIFGVWLGLILVALWLAGRLRRLDAGVVRSWPEAKAAIQGGGVEAMAVPGRAMPRGTMPGRPGQGPGRPGQGGAEARDDG